MKYNIVLSLLVSAVSSYVLPLTYYGASENTPYITIYQGLHILYMDILFQKVLYMLYVCILYS